MKEKRNKFLMYVNEFAEIYNLHPTYVRRKCAEGDWKFFPVKPVKLFGRWVWNRAKVEMHLKSFGG